MSSITDETHNSRPSSRSVQTGARPASALASVMSLLMGNPELPPISVEPSIGAIEPSATQTFNIRFSPLEVAQFQGRLLCRYNHFGYEKGGWQEHVKIILVTHTYLLFSQHPQLAGRGSGSLYLGVWSKPVAPLSLWLGGVRLHQWDPLQPRPPGPKHQGHRVQRCWLLYAIDKVTEKEGDECFVSLSA